MDSHQFVNKNVHTVSSIDITRTRSRGHCDHMFSHLLLAIFLFKLASVPLIRVDFRAERRAHAAHWQRALGGAPFRYGPQPIK